MSIVRTAKGTQVGNSDGGGLFSITMANVTLQSGSTIVVLVGIDENFAPPDSVKWNNQMLTLAVSATASSRPYVGIFYKANVTGATGSVVVDATVSDPSSITMAVLEITGLEVVPTLDQIASATGSSTIPTSGATPTTTQAKQILIGALCTQGPSGDDAGSWSNGFSAGQRAGTTGGTTGFKATISEGYLIVAAAAAYMAAKTGITSRPWAAAIATFQEFVSSDVIEVDGLIGDLEVFPLLEGTFIGG